MSSDADQKNQTLRRCQSLIREASQAAASDQIELARQHVTEIQSLLKNPYFPDELSAQIKGLCRNILREANDTRTERQVLGAFAKILSEGK